MSKVQISGPANSLQADEGISVHLVHHQKNN